MKREILVLGIETALAAGSLCLLRAGQPIASYGGMGSALRADNLVPSVEDLFRSNGLPMSSLDLIGVSTGPGSFTGVRVGVATARALALALGRPCLGISVLDVLREAMAPAVEGDLMTVVGGGRNRVYWRHFQCVRPAGAGAEASRVRLSDIKDFVTSLTEEPRGDVNVIVEGGLYDTVSALIAETGEKNHIKLQNASDNVAKMIALSALNLLNENHENLQNLSQAELTYEVLAEKSNWTF